MAKVRFIADTTPTGIWGSLLLDIVDGDQKVGDFMRVRKARQVAEEKKAADEGRAPERYLLQVEMSVAYRPRTMKQQNLQWELCNRIGAADHVDPETVHAAVKDLVYPKEEHYGSWVAKAGEELTTVEYAKAIDWLIHECVDRPDPVDIADIWQLFTEWRYGQETDPIDYITPEAYREYHPLCEACGKFLLERDATGEYHNVGHLSHIVGRGAGGPEYATWDVVMLCAAHHVGGAEGDPAAHTQGWEAILQIAPWLRKKVERARARPHPNAQAQMVQAVFDGKVVQGKIESDPALPTPDTAKQKMLDKLQILGAQAAARQQELYPPRKEKEDD